DMMIHSKFRTSLLILAASFLCQIAVAGSPAAGSLKSPTVPTLPTPTGPFAVGKVTVHWVDESRVEPLSPNHEPREVMVDIWYPAEPSNAAPAEYLDAAGYEKAMGADGFQSFFREATEALRQGIQTHAIAAALYASSAKLSPVLI